MVVRHLLLAATLWACVASWAIGQTSAFRVETSTLTPEVDQPFRFTVKITGRSMKTLRLPNVPNLVLANKQESRSALMVNGVTSSTAEFSYTAVVKEAGTTIIPAMNLEIDGKVYRSPAIELKVHEKPAVRIWIDSTSVTVNVPFRIFVSAVGEKVAPPFAPNVDGIRIDSGKTTRTQETERRSGKSMTRYTYGFHAVAEHAGLFTVPPIAASIDGVKHHTESFPIKAVAQRALNPDGNVRLYKEDLVFTRAEVDKEEVFQGEPIVLHLQLWRIIYGGIDSGAHPRADIRPPTTEGFYEAALAPSSGVRLQGAWEYNVVEERKLLYPTTTGDLTIGSWHWEGRAYVPSRNSRSRFNREAYDYRLDSDAITIKVKPLPKRPPEFSGAVGTFTIDGALSEKSLLQGVPVKLIVLIKGEGNPDAIADPRIEKMKWAHISIPKRETRIAQDANAARLITEKQFTYTVTPLEPGAESFPKVTYTFFDPAEAEYKTVGVGPFPIEVVGSGEAEQRLVVSRDVALAGQQLSILGRDIRPPKLRPAHLKAERSSQFAAPVVGALPVVLFLLLVGYTSRQRKFQTDHGFARGYRAKGKAQKNLDAVTSAPHPADALYTALATFVSDHFNVAEAGLTSADVEELLSERGVEAGLATGTVKILRACERARYASQELSSDELVALLTAARTCVEQFTQRKNRHTQ